MTIHHPVIGCDVSMAHLDLFDAQHKASQRIENSAQAIDQWLQTVCDRKPFVVFEATGSYDLQLRRCLDSAGIAFTRVNPVKARNFARATGILAKTDKVDAAMLASMGQSLALQPDPPSCPQKQRLDELSTRRDQLVAMRKQEQTRLKQTHDESLRHDIKSHIDQLSERLVRIEQQCRDVVRATARLVKQHDLMCSVPGIGSITATVLLASLPELGMRSRRSIAALAGLAPIARDSGQKNARRFIMGGRSRVRRAMYMAALTAAHSCPRFAAFYQTLIGRGTAKKAALIAVARKLLVIVNAVVREQRAYSG